MKVRLLDLAAQHRQTGTEVESAVRRVLASGHYILGEEVVRFEQAIAERMQRSHGIGVASGSDALLVSLMALDVKPGDEVITTALSFFATAGAIARLGARPVFADVEPNSFNLDPNQVLDRVTKRTRGIIPVHLFGRPATVAPLKKAGVPVVEDAAQALAATGVGQFGRLTTLSFFPSKNLGAAGDAGMVLTDDPELADRVRLLRAHGSRPKYVHHAIGGNFRIDALQAAILMAKLPFLAAWQHQRQRNATRYRELLSKTPLTLPGEVAGHVWHHFVVRAPERDRLRTHLQTREIETEIYYPTPLHLQPCFAELGGRRGDFPHAEKACTEVLALPVHPDLSDEQIDFVADTIREFYS